MVIIIIAIIKFLSASGVGSVSRDIVVIITIIIMIMPMIMMIGDGRRCGTTLFWQCRDSG